MYFLPFPVHSGSASPQKQKAVEMRTERTGTSDLQEYGFVRMES
jgi:hypothetical protein